MATPTYSITDIQVAVHLGLEAANEVNEKRMSCGVDDFKDVFLWHKTFHLVTGQNVGFLEGFDSKVLASWQMLWQHHLTDKDRQTFFDICVDANTAS